MPVRRVSMTVDPDGPNGNVVSLSVTTQRDGRAVSAHAHVRDFDDYHDGDNDLANVVRAVALVAQRYCTPVEPQSRLGTQYEVVVTRDEEGRTATVSWTLRKRDRFGEPWVECDREKDAGAFDAAAGGPWLWLPGGFYPLR
jgi:hypothetical protein